MLVVVAAADADIDGDSAAADVDVDADSAAADVVADDGVVFAYAVIAAVVAIAVWLCWMSQAGCDYGRGGGVPRRGDEQQQAHRRVRGRGGHAGLLPRQELGRRRKEGQDRLKKLHATSLRLKRQVNA